MAKEIVMRGTELLLCQGKKELADELFCSSIKLKSADQKSSSHRVLKNLRSRKEDEATIRP